MAISVNPTAATRALQAKAQQLEVWGGIGGVFQQHRDADGRGRDKIRANQWSCSSFRQKWKRKCVPLPLRTAIMMNETLWDQLNILSLSEKEDVHHPCQAVPQMCYFHMIVVCRWVNDNGTEFEWGGITRLQLPLWYCSAPANRPPSWFWRFMNIF